jgi:hypothetical protein
LNFGLVDWLYNLFLFILIDETQLFPSLISVKFYYRTAWFFCDNLLCRVLHKMLDQNHFQNSYIHDIESCDTFLLYSLRPSGHQKDIRTSCAFLKVRPWSKIYLWKVLMYPANHNGVWSNEWMKYIDFLIWSLIVIIYTHSTGTHGL